MASDATWERHDRESQLSAAGTRDGTSGVSAASDAAGPMVTSTDFLLTAKELGIPVAWVIVDLAPDGVLVIDGDGRILLANRGVEELFGYNHRALVGMPVECLLPTRLRHAHEAHRARYSLAPSLRRMGSGLQLVGEHADGSEFPIDVSLSPAATDKEVVTVVAIRSRS